MGLLIKYRNSLGTIEMCGDRGKEIRVTSLEGMGPAEKEYDVAIFSGYDGQETISSRALPRYITIGMEFFSRNQAELVKNTLKILSQPGYLIIEDGNFSRRIFCNQIKAPAPERILRGQISTLVVQFICDNPYFEDGQESGTSLYRRTKNLFGKFSLPRVFGETATGETINNVGVFPIEPIIAINCLKKLDKEETVIIANKTTGKSIKFTYAPKGNDEIIIDIKNRTIISNTLGNLINNLSDDSFLGDFVLVLGKNDISVSVGNVSSGFAVECRFSNLYDEAVIV